ncbi:MAG: hypothetical protein IJX99_02110 [Clostridia bacterium]|nr:hypothetical protein [Clostridia bacterium]
MMTGSEFKNKIKNYIDIVRGIRDLNERIKKLETTSKIVKDSVKGSSNEYPFIQKTCVVEGMERNERLKRKKKILKKKQKELEIVKDELELYINTEIKEERIRQILEYKYIDGFSWVKIAFKMKATSEESVRKELERFLKKL